MRRAYFALTIAAFALGAPAVNAEKLKAPSRLSCKELGKESIWLAQECNGLPNEIDKTLCDPGKRMNQVAYWWERRRCR